MAHVSSLDKLALNRLGYYESYDPLSLVVKLNDSCPVICVVDLALPHPLSTQPWSLLVLRVTATVPLVQDRIGYYDTIQALSLVVKL